MVIGINPVLATLGSLELRWAGVLAVLGILVGGAVGVGYGSRHGTPLDPLLDTLAVAIPAGVVGARAWHVVSAWDYYVTRPGEVWQLGLGGLSLWGGLVVAGAAVAVGMRHDHRLRGLVADAAAFGLPLGIAIGRIGGLVNGDGLGQPTSLPWGTQYVYEAAMSPDFGVPRHPVQIYDALAALLSLGVTLLLPRRAPPATRLWVFLLLYGCARIGLSPLRLDPALIMGFQADDILAALMVGWSLVQLVISAARAQGGRVPWQARATAPGKA